MKNYLVSISSTIFNRENPAQNMGALTYEYEVFAETHTDAEDFATNLHFEVTRLKPQNTIVEEVAFA